MIRQLVFRPRVADDISACTAYIAAESVEAAIRWLDCIDLGCKQLQSHPFLGQLVTSSVAELASFRTWQVPKYENYLIVYTVSDACVEVIRILHTSRDLPKLLDSEIDS